MFRPPLSLTLIQKISFETVKNIADESAFFGETLRVPENRLRQIVASTDAVGELRRKYLDYRMGGDVSMDELNALLEQTKNDIGIKQGAEIAKIVVESIDSEIAKSLKGMREV